MVLTEPDRRKVTVLRFLLVTIALVLLVARAQADQRGREKLSWDELVAKYAKDYPAIVLEHTYDVEILFDTNLQMSTRITDRRELAVFDAEKAQRHLTLSFLIGPGMKVKNKKAWSMEYRNGEFVSGASTQESDYSVRKLSGGRKSLHIAAPGITHQGYVTYEVELQSNAPPFYDFVFYNSLPVRYGRCDLHVPTTSEGTQRGVNEMLRYVAISTRGYVERIEPEVQNKREVAMAWEMTDLAPLYNERMVPAEYQPHASISIVRADLDWTDWVDWLYGQLKKTKAPKKLVKAAKDTLKDRSDEEIVFALARHIDNPLYFEVTGDPRHLDFVFPDLEEVVRNREGSVFTKAILISRLLKELKVKHHVVLGSSRNESIPNWQTPSLRQLDAALIRIPSISPQFLWDVGNPGVPIGVPGADLYSKMLVLDPKNDEPVVKFEIEPGLYKEIRALDYTLGDDGTLSGEWVCRFESYPLAGELNPWKQDTNLTAEMAEVMPEDFTIHEVSWREVNWTTMRCTKDSPAILTCRIEHEALPAGETGWEVRPFYLPLPKLLDEATEKNRRGPLLLTDGTEISESILVRLEGKSATHLPDSVEKKNGVGSFYSGWEMREDGVFATRTLSIFPGVLQSSRIRQARALCQAWEDAGEQSVVIE